jgi:hypothetical protein
MLRIDGAPRTLSAMRVLVGHRAPTGHRARAPLGRLGERALDHGDEGARVEGLGDGVDGARLLHELAADLVALRAHQHDRQRAVRARAQLATELVAVHARHHEVEQHELDLHPRGADDARFPRRRRAP